MLKKMLLSLAVIAALLSVPAVATGPTDLTPYSPLPLTSAIGAGLADSAFVACDAVNGNSFTATGTEMIELYNSDASPHTVTITSVADNLGRTGDITAYSIAAGHYSVFGPFKQKGWMNTSQKIVFTASDVTVKARIIRVPTGF